MGHDSGLCHAAFLALPTPVVVLQFAQDETWNVAGASQATLRLLECDESNCIGRPASEVFRLFGRDWRACLERVRRSGVPEFLDQFFPERPQDPSGRSVRVERLRDDAVLAIAHAGGRLGNSDIDALLSAQARAQESERRLRLLAAAFDAAANGIVITTRTGTILYANEAVSRLTGYPIVELIGGHTRILRSGRNPESVYADLWATICRGEVWRGTLINRRFDGSHYVEEQTITPVLDDSGHPTHFVAIKQDVTDRVDSEAKLMRAHTEAEKANQAKTLFLANMSHEVRTPLNAVLGYAQLLAESGLSQRQLNHLSKLETSARGLLLILTQILEFSRMEGGSATVSHAWFDIQEVVHVVQTITGVSAVDRGIVLDVSIDEEIPRPLLGDTARLTQVLLNLVGNAIKFTDKGSVSLRVNMVEGSDENITCTFSIEDTGIGMSKDELERIFVPFSQASAETGPRFGGTGLGLALSQRLVSLMGGQISVESRKGQGSRFYFTLTFPRRAYVRESVLRKTIPPGTLRPPSLEPRIRLDLPAVRALVTRLATEIARNSTRSNRTAEELEPFLIGTPHEETMQSLLNQLRRFDFDGGLQTLGRLRGNLNAGLLAGDRS